MKIIMFIAIVFLLNACDNKSKFGFTSSNCNEVYTNCMNKCTQGNQPKNKCLESCDKSRSMCEAVKTKGCMQDCNKVYGKGSQQAETCKQRCINNRGVRY